MKQNAQSRVGYYTIGIAALFLIGFLLLVIFGARSYQAAAARQNTNNDTRALLSYLSARIHSGDESGAVSVRDSGAGTMLVITDNATSETEPYETRVYLADGELVEEYTSHSAECMPESAQHIGKTDIFTIEQPRVGLLCITTAAGQIYVSLRSEGDASP